MNGTLGRKAAIVLLTAAIATASGAARADHDVDIVTPLVTLFAVGALLNYDHGAHHYRHYYHYRRHGHYPRHRYHGHKHRAHGYYRKRHSNHGYYHKPRRRSHSHGGYHRH